jgi:hypothetical protein
MAVKKRKLKHKILFTILIALAVVAFWRGAWGLMDTFLFPENYLLSSLTSLFLGLIILMITKYIHRELL